MCSYQKMVISVLHELHSLMVKIPYITSKEQPCTDFSSNYTTHRLFSLFVKLLNIDSVPPEKCSWLMTAGGGRDLALQQVQHTH